jgi:hypothetical protein
VRADPSVFEVARLPDHSAAGLYALACVPELMDAALVSKRPAPLTNTPHPTDKTAPLQLVWTGGAA